MGVNRKWKREKNAEDMKYVHTPRDKDTPLPSYGFSSFELAIVIAVICAFFVAGAYFLNVTSQSAYDIMAKHDLQAFVDFQEYYFKLTGRCIGDQGQSVRNDGIKSDIDDYTVSEGVCITFVSGDPRRPNDPDNPVIFQAKHEKSDTVFEYNFQSGKMIER